MMEDVFPYLSIGTSIAAAILGLRAATITIRDSMDQFIADLQRQGRWAAFAATLAAVSVVFQSLDRLLQ
ncbi:hypothetical protein [Neoaquamicrobium sediminum]|uniref:hypothetical protein n=1 Tax=Neoaquamicrobium sediminum TaxID=1849104 RepID=UPI001562F2FE|nr:hypothetical protein [Mesorhizobium sediminum]NRC52994.1 hypothetical protein [Mesorhizobium sediminum]